MMKSLLTLTAALLFTAGGFVTAQAALTDLGPSIAPHGYPAWYSDGNVQLELCVPPPAGNATAADQMCIFDPIDETHPLILVGEGFYWMASSSIAMPGGGNAAIEFALESTFGGAEEPINGQQITFVRTRIRIDTPVAGTYTITHPYGSEEFVVAVGAEEDGINMTADIGSANFLFPERAFAGALTGPVGPFLTWPNFRTIPELQVTVPVVDENGDPVLDESNNPVTRTEQYVGDPNIPSTVTGGTNGNIFRVVGPVGSGIDLQTDQWLVMGKEYDETIGAEPHEWPLEPEPNLFAVGPVNRTDYFLPPLIEPPLVAVAGASYSEDYSLGYPHWYQEALTVTNPDTQLEERVGGLRLTLCPPGNVMCISDPIIPTAVDPDPDNGIAEGQVALMTGGEGFWYYASASFDDGEDSYFVEFALESTFGGDESLVDGNQISFARERIRFDFDDDKPVATYRVTHPYGVRILEGDPERLDRIRFGLDIGIADLADPDGAHIGTLYGDIGPTFLKWDTFVDPATLSAEQLGANYPVQDLVTVHDAEAGLYNYHIGNPNIPHEVLGGPNGNIFRVERLVSGTVEDGEWEVIDETPLFVVSGKVYDDETFPFALDLGALTAFPDAATLDLRQEPSIVIDVTANDTVLEGAPATIIVVGAPVDGTIANIDSTNGTVTYTPTADFALEGGVDTFTYQLSQTIEGITQLSNTVEVTVTVIPVETITVSKARLELRRLRWDIRGTSNFDGTTLTLYAGETATGTPIGTAAVDAGRWAFRGTSTTNPNVTSVTVVNEATGTTASQPLQVR